MAKILKIASFSSDTNFSSFLQDVENRCPNAQISEKNSVLRTVSFIKSSTDHVLDDLGRDWSANWTEVLYVNPRKK